MTVETLLGSISSDELTEWITREKLRAAAAEAERKKRRM
jgi:hypothetical protein